ncbi:MAG: peptide chain release factor N(5)-glutamine methyltransferase [Azospirillaceae bacterium]|nr:peptide chain release factor N(5)-glutamine methyltransferase [Azospirillaceae bacterium]
MTEIATPAQPVAGPRPENPTLRDTVRAGAALLRQAAIDDPDLDARLLVQHALGLSRERLMIQATARLNQPQLDRVMALIRRRAAREPVSRILGHREFWSLDFLLAPATLDPRPDSETLIQATLDGIGDRRAPLRLLDLGTGSGCLLLALLQELPAATGLGVDKAAAAVAAAAVNATRLGLADRARFVEGDWCTGLTAPFDVIISNPPYIATGVLPGLQPEVRLFDPPLALDGGADGLAAYRALAQQAPALLSERGRLVLEIGFDQRETVTAILEAAQLAIDAVHPDLGGVPRCIVARRRAGAGVPG